MGCGKSFTTEDGAQWKITVTEVSGVSAFVGRLLFTDWDGGHDDSPPPKKYTRKQLEKGITIELKPKWTYNLDVVVAPSPGKDAVVRTVMTLDGNALMDKTCTCTKTSPLCEWEMTHL